MRILLATERALIVSDGPELAMPDWLQTSRAPSTPSRIATLEEHERAHILDALEATGWRVSGPGGTAEVLGLPPSTLESRMKKLGVARKR